MKKTNIFHTFSKTWEGQIWNQFQQAEKESLEVVVTHVLLKPLDRYIVLDSIHAHFSSLYQYFYPIHHFLQLYDFGIMGNLL